MTLVLAVAVLLLGALMVLTALGQRRRGGGLLLAAAAGFLLPVTWTVWYLRDVHPYRTAPSA